MRIAIVNSSSFGKIFPEHLERLGRLGEVQRFEFPPTIGGEDLARALQGFPVLIVSVAPRFSPSSLRRRTRRG